MNFLNKCHRNFLDKCQVSIRGKFHQSAESRAVLPFHNHSSIVTMTFTLNKSATNTVNIHTSSDAIFRIKIARRTSVYATYRASTTKSAEIIDNESANKVRQKGNAQATYKLEGL